MRIPVAVLVLALAVGATPDAAHADVSVSFIEPQRYTDAGLRGDWRVGPNDPVLLDLRHHLAALGERYLQRGDALAIEVLDIDLAGRYEPRRAAAQAVRFMRDDTWPRVKVRYSLTRAGQVVLAREETISDPDYLARAGGRPASEPLFFEKAMLENWFRARFGSARY